MKGFVPVPRLYFLHTQPLLGAPWLNIATCSYLAWVDRCPWRTDKRGLYDVPFPEGELPIVYWGRASNCGQWCTEQTFPEGEWSKLEDYELLRETLVRGEKVRHFSKIKSPWAVLCTVCRLRYVFWGFGQSWLMWYWLRDLPARPWYEWIAQNLSWSPDKWICFTRPSWLVGKDAYLGIYTFCKLSLLEGSWVLYAYPATSKLYHSTNRICWNFCYFVS